MNVAFLTRCQLDPHRGGTERITLSIANQLQKYKFNVYSLYFIPSQDNELDTIKHFRINRLKICHELPKFIEDNKIDVLILQGEFQLIKQIRKGLKRRKDCKIIAVHHFEPGYEEKFTSIKSIFRILFNNRNLKEG